MKDLSFLKDNTFVVVDIETTGLSPTPKSGDSCRIIEIGAVKIENGKITKTYSTFCSCPTHIPYYITEITGITDKDLVGAPCVKDSLIKLNDFCNNSFLIGHNLKFDLSFLNHYGKEIGIEFNQKYYDTLTLARKYIIDKVPNCKLGTIADYFGVKFRHHRALDDAIATAEIFLKFVTEF